MTATAALSSRNELDQLADLFGGAHLLNHPMSNPIEAHDMILQGIPSRALERLLVQLLVIDPTDAAFEAALGMSERTFQRHRADQTRTLNRDQSSRTWNFARILTRATSVLGSQAEAETWMMQPAMGLDNRRPIDLLATAAGREVVQEFLDRLDYGVYT